MSRQKVLRNIGNHLPCDLRHIQENFNIQSISLVYVYIYIHIYIEMYICWYVCVCVYIYIYMYIYCDLYTCIYIYIHTYIPTSTLICRHNSTQRAVQNSYTFCVIYLSFRAAVDMHTVTYLTALNKDNFRYAQNIKCQFYLQ